MIEPRSLAMRTPPVGQDLSCRVNTRQLSGRPGNRATAYDGLDACGSERNPSSECQRAHRPRLCRAGQIAPTDCPGAFRDAERISIPDPQVTDRPPNGLT